MTVSIEDFRGDWVFLHLPPGIWRRVQKWGEERGDGGWQGLCADLMKCEISEMKFVREAEMAGVDRAFSKIYDCLEALQESFREDDEDQ